MTTPSATTTPVTLVPGTQVQGLPWNLLAPAGSQVIEVRGRRAGVVEQLRALPPQAPVLILDGRPGARGRLRRLARAAGVQVERECVVLPSLRSALFVADDAPLTISWLCRSALTVPPGTTWLAAPVDLAVRALGRLVPWRFLGTIAPGRAISGRTP